MIGLLLLANLVGAVGVHVSRHHRRLWLYVLLAGALGMLLVNASQAHWYVTVGWAAVSLIWLTHLDRELTP